MSEQQVATTPPAGGIRRELGRIVRFCLVGATNTVITFAAYAALTAAGCDAPVASAIAFGIGAINSYQLNRRWTFSDVPTARDAWLRFATIQGFGALLSAGGVAAVEGAGWGHLTAECAILPFVTAVVYCLSRLLVFRSDAPACER
jgi:putative flippase GtrA